MGVGLGAVDSSNQARAEGLRAGGSEVSDHAESGRTRRVQKMRKEDGVAGTSKGTCKGLGCRELVTENGSVPGEHTDGQGWGSREEGRQAPWAEATDRWTSGCLSTRDHFSLA